MTAALNELSASEAARLIAAGEITAEALVEACIQRIEAREDTVGAWAWFEADHARDQARARDRAEPAARGPLHGVPIAVKDLFDTADMPTAMGSPIYAGRRPITDASVVAQVRAAGAVILGKTVTTEFAAMHPGKTANPHNPAHTPGGSSSGSAAAVADFMVPVGFGTQTAGSVVRPAAFCGAVGYKPTFGTYNRAGVKPTAESLDTIGLIARTIDDVELVSGVLTGRAAPAEGSPPARLPRIALCRTHLWPLAEAESRAAVEDAAERLADAGAAIETANLPDGFETLTEHHLRLMTFELARGLAGEFHRHRDALSAWLGDMIEGGLAIDFDDCVEAVAAGQAARRRVPEFLAPYDAVLTLSASGEAPRGLEATGDYRFQTLWTFLHVPCVTLPTHSGPTGLPVGVQLVGRAHEDGALLAVARWAMDALGTGSRIRL